MESIKEINTKNRSFYVLMIWSILKKINSNLLKTDKSSYISTDVYYIGYITIKGHLDIHKVNPFYLIINEVLNFCLYW